MTGDAKKVNFLSPNTPLTGDGINFNNMPTPLEIRPNVKVSVLVFIVLFMHRAPLSIYLSLFFCCVSWVPSYSI
jgi:hypothetical protein